MKFVFSTVLVLFSSIALAVTPSPAQLEQFKKLPKAQQQQLAKSYGIDLNALNKSAQLQTTESKPEEGKLAVDKEREVDAAVEIKEDLGIADAKPANVEKNKLKPFGYDILASEPTSFEPLKNVPVPAEYVLGPGDVIKVQLFGKAYQSLDVTVDRNGTFIIPETGPIQVAGLTFSEFKEFFNQQIEQKVIGVSASVTMGELRSIRVFVLGEAYKPGAYTVNSLSTITHALFAAGGITEVGSLRNVQLKRRGKLITTLDLYDLLLAGDTSSDANLLPGDVVFIPPAGDFVGVTGEVKRPALYELKGKQTAQQVLQLAGGVLPTAYKKVSKLERINAVGARTVVDLDLTSKTAQQKAVQNGDVLRIHKVLDEMQEIVELKGHVHRSGVYAWKQGIRVLDIIGNISNLQINPDLDYALIVREEDITRKISTLQFSIAKALANPSSENNVELKVRDQIYVLSAETERELTEVVQRLIAQARRTEPAKIVEVVGNVKHPAIYPLSNGMTVQKLIEAGFDLELATDLNYALLKRRNYEQNKTEFEVLSLNSQDDLNLVLREQDKLYIFNVDESRAELLEDLILEIEAQTTKEHQRELVSIQGQVRFPGTYPLAKGMSLSELIASAGGYTESSYLVDLNVSRFHTNGVDSSKYELAKISLESDQIEQFELQPRDAVFVKRIPDWFESETVELMGEFKFPGKYVIKKGETIAELVQRAGGFTEYAAKNASIFTREYLRLKEQKLLDDAHTKLKRELISTRINQGMTSDTETILGLIEELSSTEAVGRMVIEIDQFAINERSIELRDGDRLIIPRKNKSVAVIGEVYQPTSLPWSDGAEMDDYIIAAGGFNQLAEEGDAYIIKANGRVISDSSWFISNGTIEPGDTVVVPTNVDPVPKLTLWRDITSIISQSATTLGVIAAL